MADVLDSPEAGPAAVRGGALRAVGYGATVVLSIGSAALLFRHLGVDDAGRYVTAMSIVAVVAGLTDAGLTAIGIREIAAQGPIPGSRLLRELLGIRLVLTTLGVLGAVGFTALAGYGVTLELGVALVGFALVLQNLQLTLSIPLQVELRFGAVVAADIVRQTVLALAVVALVLAGAGLVPLLATSIPAALAALLLTVVLLRRTVPMRPAFTLQTWRSLFREALPYAITGAVISVYFRVAIVVVSLVASEDETGFFSASFRIIDVLVVVPQLVVGAAFPIFARAAADDHVRLAYGFQRVFDVALILGAWMAVSLAVSAGFAIAVVAGPDFAPAADVLRIQGIALVGSFVAGATGYVLLSLRLYTPLMLVSVVALVTTAGLAAVLAAANGATGAALATVSGELVLAVGSLIVLWIRQRHLFPSFAIAPRVALASAGAFSVWLLPDMPELLLGVLATLVYGGLLLALRAIPEEALMEVKRLAAR